MSGDDSEVTHYEEEAEEAEDEEDDEEGFTSSEDYVAGKSKMKKKTRKMPNAKSRRLADDV